MPAGSAGILPHSWAMPWSGRAIIISSEFKAAKIRTAIHITLVSIGSLKLRCLDHHAGDTTAVKSHEVEIMHELALLKPEPEVNQKCISPDQFTSASAPAVIRAVFFTMGNCSLHVFPLLVFITEGISSTHSLFLCVCVGLSVYLSHTLFRYKYKMHSHLLITLLYFENCFIMKINQILSFFLFDFQPRLMWSLVTCIQNRARPNDCTV